VRTRSAIILFVVFLTALATGCGALRRISGSEPSAITFEAGELRSIEEIPIAELDPACGRAALSLGYEDVRATREKNRVLWTARTVGGDPVELQLAAKYSKRTELRIRVGVLGNEARSRLLLEQIHQSL
jgi:hypothetical protein